MTQENNKPSAALNHLRNVGRAYQRLPRPARIAVWAALVAGPVLAFSSGGGSGADESGAVVTAVAAAADDSPGAPPTGGVARGASDEGRAGATAGDGTFVRSMAATQSFDL